MYFADSIYWMLHKLNDILIILLQRDEMFTKEVPRAKKNSIVRSANLPQNSNIFYYHTIRSTLSRDLTNVAAVEDHSAREENLKCARLNILENGQINVTSGQSRLRLVVT